MIFYQFVGWNSYLTIYILISVNEYHLRDQYTITFAIHNLKHVYIRTKATEKAEG